MSITDLTTEPEVVTPPREAPGRRAPGMLWARVALACTVLVASGGARWWRARRIDAVLEQGKQSPFPLKDLPLTLGDWRGEPTTPDPEIVRTTGATDFAFRRFVNQSTGVALEVYVLYGPAVDLFLHAPENCYPAAGFALKQAAAERTVEAGPLRAPFRNLVYGRGEGAQTDLQEVYYSWRFQGRWWPDYGKFKQLERIPGMFKVQLARRVVGQERRDVGNPCEAFLQVLLPEIERRLKGPAVPAF
jgi:EpsI family protein